MSTKQVVSISLQNLQHGRLRNDCASVMQRLFPDLAGVSSRLKASISRARNGYGCPLQRTADLLIERRRTGGTRDQAELVLIFFEDLVDVLWPAEEIDVEAAMFEEQRRKWRSLELQMRAMKDPAYRLAWAEAKADEMAPARSAIRGVRAQALRVGAA